MPRHWPAALFFTTYLAIQLALPAYSHLSGNNRFRWGMFSRTETLPAVTILYPDHTTETLTQYQHRTHRARLFRKELDVSKHLISYLCAITPHPTAIRIENTLHPCQP
jgi:hypothetical protein